MIAEQQVEEDAPGPRCEDIVAHIIDEVLPLLAAAGKEGMTTRDLSPLLAEVDRLCAQHGPL
jgi:hypothetical protein